MEVLAEASREMSVVTSRAARVGVFGIGLEAYWAQFAGLRETIAGNLEHVEREIGAWSDVISGGLVDNARTAAETGIKFARADLDVIVLFPGTYATSTQVLPVVQRAGAPVVMLNLQPIPVLDYTSVDTGTWLANCGICPVPEIAGVLQRAGVQVSVVTGSLFDDYDAWADIRGWCAAARTARAIRSTRFGMLGHTYPGMIDMSTDVGLVHAQLGAHVEILEIDDLKDRVDSVPEAEILAYAERAKSQFALDGEISDEAMSWGAQVAVGLEHLVEDFDLGGLAYYYRGTGGDRTEQIAANMILGNTLLTTKGVPAAGEGDLKTAIAMKILHELGVGGSFCEFAAMDLDERFFLMGHDGPAHLGISDGLATLKDLKVFHGKAGGGLSVEMRAASGPVTILGLTVTVDGRLKLIAAEGKSLPGPVFSLGNSVHRLRFDPDLPEFMSAWCALGPTHHVALGLGHRIADIRKVAALLGLPLETV